MSKEFTQLFIMIANVKGTPVPLAFGYLPDKKEMSYYLFLYLLIEALGNQAESIKRITGRSTCYLKLKSLTCDFELSIHNGIFVYFIHSEKNINIFMQPLNLSKFVAVSSTGHRVCGEESSLLGWSPFMLMINCLEPL